LGYASFRRLLRKILNAVEKIFVIFGICLFGFSTVANGVEIFLRTSGLRSLYWIQEFTVIAFGYVTFLGAIVLFKRKPEQNFNWIRGPFRVMVSKIPVMRIDDLKKIKLRVYPADTYIRSWQALGANTTSVEWSEVYLALKQNMIQAVTSPMDLVRPMKFTEVAKYITRIDEFPQILIFVMNQKSYEKLTPTQKKALHQASDEAGDYFTRMNYDSLGVDLPYMIEQDGVTYIQVPLKEWREKIRPFYQKLEAEGKIAKGFYDMVQSLK
jgi:TRAP-type C4-dicarboxylate transport system substrate-binding protein